MVVMPQLTPDDRALLTAHLSRTRELVLSEISQLRPDQWTFRPDEETWSIAQCADHIVTIERRVFSMVSKHMQSATPDPQRAAEVQKKTPWILQAVPSRHERVKVPAGIENHTNSATPEEFLNAFEERRAKVLQYVAETQDPLHQHWSRPLTPGFWRSGRSASGFFIGDLCCGSERSHATQMAEVKAHSAYPK